MLVIQRLQQRFELLKNRQIKCARSGFRGNRDTRSLRHFPARMDNRFRSCENGYLGPGSAILMQLQYSLNDHSCFAFITTQILNVVSLRLFRQLLTFLIGLCNPINQQQLDSRFKIHKRFAIGHQCMMLIIVDFTSTNGHQLGKNIIDR